jgi:hypothetical protein
MPSQAFPSPDECHVANNASARRENMQETSTCAGWTKQQNSLDMADAKALDDRGRENARRECAPEDQVELGVQPADAQLLKVELLGFEQLRRCHVALPCD